MFGGDCDYWKKRIHPLEAPEYHMLIAFSYSIGCFCWILKWIGKVQVGALFNYIWSTCRGAQCEMTPTRLCWLCYLTRWDHFCIAPNVSSIVQDEAITANCIPIDSFWFCSVVCRTNQIRKKNTPTYLLQRASAGPAVVLNQVKSCLYRPKVK